MRIIVMRDGGKKRGKVQISAKKVPQADTLPRRSTAFPNLVSLVWASATKISTSTSELHNHSLRW
jgi:hypothetical protein